jgi:hypothetical protein
VSAADFAAPLAEARARCGDAPTLEVELGLSGRVGRQRMRGKVQAGLVPGALRLEGLAPLGSPVFILVADGGNGTLLLPRDERVLRDTPPEEILNALIGVKLGADDLRALLLGCGRQVGEPVAGRSYSESWMSVDDTSGNTLFLQRAESGWRIAGVKSSQIEITYGRFARDVPGEVHLGGQGLDLTIALAQIDRTVQLSKDQLVALKIPPDVSPISLDDLREAGPLGEK